MIVAFASLFLGLVLGVQPVTVTVTDQVAQVRLELDGREVGTATAPSWTVPVDFGSILSPHELEAIALDRSGTELARIDQRVNLPRPAAEAEVVIEGGDDGQGGVAKVTWDSVAAPSPRSVAATLDGRPLSVTDPHRIALPPYEPKQLHFLRLELDFTDTVSAVAEATFGGIYQNDTRTQLTALPVALEKGAPKKLEVADLTGWFATVGGEPLRPVAVETGPAEVVFVLDGAAQRELWALTEKMNIGRPARGGSIDRRRAPSLREARADDSTGVGRPNLSAARYLLQLGKEQYLRLMWPAPQPGAAGENRAAVELFPRAEDHPPGDGGVLWLLSEARQPPFSLSDQRLVDALAVAGMTSTLRARRRAVVLVLTEHPADASRLAPSNALRYLEQIGVPVFVWIVGEVSEPMRQVWGDHVRSINARYRLTAAVEDLSKTVDRQRIVWFEGSHLPQEIVVTGQARARRAR